MFECNILKLGADNNPGRAADSTCAVNEAIRLCRGKRGRKRIVFPEGEYHFYEGNAFKRQYFISNNDPGLKKITFPLIGINELEIIGENASFIFHGRLTAFAVDSCKDIRLSGFSIDYSRPFVSRGKVLSSDKNSMDVEFPNDEIVFERDGLIHFFDDDFTNQRFNYNYLEYDLENMEILHDTVNARTNKSGKILERNKVRFFDLSKPARQGATIVMKHEPRLNPAIFINETTNVGIKDIFLYHSNAMGLIAQNSNNIFLDNYNVTLPENSSRLTSSSDDALHFVNCGGKIAVKNCILENQWDDALNLHGIYSRIKRRGVGAESFLLLESGHYQQLGILRGSIGDKVEFVHNDTMRSYHEAVIEEIIPMNPQHTSVKFSGGLPEDLQAGDCIANLSRTPQLEVENCRISSNIPRGILCTTPRKINIAGNYFHTPGAAIYISGDCNFWFESGAVNDVKIVNNEFDNCNYMPGTVGRAVIDIFPEIPHYAEKNYYHRNISIENNRFNTFESALVNADSVENLNFSDNMIVSGDKYPKYHNQLELVECKHCRNVTRKHNLKTGKK
jgi:hypothetical protein